MNKKILILLSILIISSIIHIFIGTEFYSLRDFINDPYANKVLLNIRLPRTVLAILAGISLAISGAYMQTITKNPIASPSLLGVSDGALLGVAISYAYFGSAPLIVTNFLAILFSFIAVLLIFIFASLVKNGFSKVKLAIIGIIISGYIHAFATIFALNTGSVQSVDHFFLGGMMNATWVDVIQLLITLIIAFIPIIYLNKSITYFLLDDKALVSLGMNVKRKKIIILIVTVILGAVTTAVVGKLTFLGLVAPNIAKLIVKDQRRYLIPISALVGATLVMVGDIIAQLINYPYEISLTVILTIIGVPYFFYLVNQRREI